MSVVVLEETPACLVLQRNHQQRKPIRAPITRTPTVAPAAIAAVFLLVGVLAGTQTPPSKTASTSHTHMPWFGEAWSPHPGRMCAGQPEYCGLLWRRKGTHPKHRTLHTTPCQQGTLLLPRTWTCPVPARSPARTSTFARRPTRRQAHGRRRTPLGRTARQDSRRALRHILGRRWRFRRPCTPQQHRAGMRCH